MTQITLGTEFSKNEKHYSARPLLKNWQGFSYKPVAPDYIEPCSKCGQDCIVRPELEKIASQSVPNFIGFVCTECAVKAHIEHKNIVF